MKSLLIPFLIISLFISLDATSASSQAKLIESLQKQIKEKDDYIQLLETFIKQKLFASEDHTEKPQATASSFLQTQEKLAAKSKAGPVLKAMLFGFPNPRSYTFGSQNAKGEGKDYYQNLKICEPGCVVA